MALMKSKTLSVAIGCDPKKVYEFVSNPENLPRWASAFCQSVRQVNNEWIIETPQGPMKVRFSDQNILGILDHYVSPAPPGVEIFVPMRVLSSGSGSTVIFTLFRQMGMSDEKYAEDQRWVKQDLNRLKNILES